MKTEYINTNNRPLRVFNTVMCMRRYIFNITLWTLFLCLSGHSYAGTWKDNFDEAVLNGWERIVDENPWNTKWTLHDQVLLGSISKPKQEGVTAVDFLHWNIHEFQRKHLTVVGEGIHYSRHAFNTSGELCLFLGKRQPAPDFAAGYIFSPEKITKMQFSADGVYKTGEVKADYGLMFRLTSGDIRVVFDTGKFRLFTQDLFIEEFIDAEINTVDVIGLVVLNRFPGRRFIGRISTFSVSGKDIPNNNTLNVHLHSTQLTTTWGELKRF